MTVHWQYTISDPTVLWPGYYLSIHLVMDIQDTDFSMRFYHGKRGKKLSYRSNYTAKSYVVSLYGCMACTLNGWLAGLSWLNRTFSGWLRPNKSTAAHDGCFGQILGEAWIDQSVGWSVSFHERSQKYRFFTLIRDNNTTSCDSVEYWEKLFRLFSLWTT